MMKGKTKSQESKTTRTRTPNNSRVYEHVQKCKDKNDPTIATFSMPATSWRSKYRNICRTLTYQCFGFHCSGAVAMFEGNCTHPHFGVFKAFPPIHGPPAEGEMLDFLGISNSIPAYCEDRAMLVWVWWEFGWNPWCITRWQAALKTSLSILTLARCYGDNGRGFTAITWIFVTFWLLSSSHPFLWMDGAGGLESRGTVR